ncbi:MAG: helix-turn-helix domain-containing protein [Pseudomonadota bacterium]
MSRAGFQVRRIVEVTDHADVQYLLRGDADRDAVVLQFCSADSHLIYTNSMPACGAVSILDPGRVYFILPIQRMGMWTVNKLELQDDCIYFCTQSDAAYANAPARGLLAGHVSRDSFVSAVARLAGVDQEDVLIPHGNFWLGRQRLLRVASILLRLVTKADWRVEDASSPDDQGFVDREIASVLALAAIASQPIRSDANHAESYSLVKRATELMESRNHTLSMMDVCRLTGVKPWALINAFNTVVGMPPGAYTRARRMAFARRELILQSGGRSPVKRAALNYGFQQLGRFSKDYRSIYGELPSETIMRSKPGAARQLRQ